MIDWQDKTPARIMLQCTVRDGSKGCVAPTILRWSLDQRTDAEVVLARYNTAPKHGETYALITVNKLGYRVD